LQIGRAMWVSIIFVAVPLSLAQWIFRRRDVAGP
jgi:ABC-type transport system involved in multi-copper enzyme maturation permease subunit